MAASTVPRSIPKEYEQDFAIRELKKDLEKLTRKVDDISQSVASLHVGMVEMKAELEGKINENLWKTLVGIGILLGIFKYFS